jgi:UrcA family protein
MKSVILFATAVAALGAAPAAFASDAPQVVVEYSAADLASNSALAALRNEIAAAANEVCVAPDQPTLAERRQRNACIEAAITGAEAQLNDRVAGLGVQSFAELEAARTTAS